MSSGSSDCCGLKFPAAQSAGDVEYTDCISAEG